MDPITQALTGAVAAQATLSGKLGRSAWIFGAVGGELADIDVLFSAWADPALPFELHRHFTHSLAFIPAGGLLAAAPFLLFSRWRSKWLAVIGACTIGYATHGLLDNCTSYGTHLLWPFIGDRTAWDSMSIIDPLYTLLLAMGVMLTIVLKRARPARVALALGLAYIGLGFAQHEQGLAMQRQIAEQRGHRIERGRVMPTLGNLVVWRSLYEADGRLYADALRLPPFGEASVRAGQSRPRFSEVELRGTRLDSPRTRDVIARFSAFATGFTARGDEDWSGGGFTVGDMRYSLVTGGFAPLWGLAFLPDDAATPVRSIGMQGNRDGALGQLWNDLMDPGPEFVPMEVMAPSCGDARSAR